MQTDVRIKLRDLFNEVKNVYYVEDKRYTDDRYRWDEERIHLDRMKIKMEDALQTIGEAFLNGLV
jgi:hypothetical protein